LLRGSVWCPDSIRAGAKRDSAGSRSRAIDTYAAREGELAEGVAAFREALTKRTRERLLLAQSKSGANPLERSRSQHYQTEMGSPRDRFSATVGIELGEDRRDMELGGVERDS
jgi:hypothetical protein